MNTEDRGIIFNGVGVKPGALPEFFTSVDPALVPNRIVDYGTAYTYEYIKGREARPADIDAVLHAADWIWSIPFDNIHPRHVNDYCERVANLADEAKINHQVIGQALVEILGTDLPQVSVVHGDMTLENIIITPEYDVKFIDPGHAYRVNTPALDKGKLLQSIVMRWEERNKENVTSLSGYHPWLQPGPMPTWAGPIEWAFLVTHWVRLIKYWPELDTRCGFDVLQQVKPGA